MWLFVFLAVRTGLEPATLGVTGRYSNQLNYHTRVVRITNFVMAVRTGLEPATLGVTGRYSNQLNYHTRINLSNLICIKSGQVFQNL